MSEPMSLRPVGHVESPLTDRADAPKQHGEDAPDAWLVLDPALADAYADLAPGDDVVVLTWLHQADRDVLSVHPRGDRSRPIRGVFSTRSPARPNPIGLHLVRVAAVDGNRVQVQGLEAIDGTPLLDIKSGDRGASRSSSCVFCAPEPERVFFENDDLRLLWDAFPVTPGHALVVPRRHVTSWFEATHAERVALLGGIEHARQVIAERYGPTDFNIGVNVGEAAGQTVPHLHVHVIPRRPGDVADPRGGVRHVIPGKGNYLDGAG